MKGTIIVFQDYQRFDLVEVKPYVRKQDGMTTKLFVFRSRCIACDRRFKDTTTMNSLNNAGRLNRRCKRCRRKEAKLIV
jgi:hypothetical protein